VPFVMQEFGVRDTHPSWRLERLPVDAALALHWGAVEYRTPRRVNPGLTCPKRADLLRPDPPGLSLVGKDP
jgi:hypothetical protein